ncbi:MAG TPA: CpsD/CapB family tyrosine-protein kinase [Lachnospiraceae bacterium]|nr:CpsD/CapB family tyrosine-protein kinase [Lachnospiraceae bacterium]
MEKIAFEKREELDYSANEAYKALRTNIQFSGDDIKVIALTSCTPNEGKSSVSFNLAVSFAQSGKKVILIDADLRKSVLVGRYKVGAIEKGLTHYLSGQEELANTIFETDVENMHIIFSGPIAPNPSELLGNQNFIDMIGQLREEYDYVIIDTPPLGSVIDSAIVAKVTDGAMIVIENGAISYHFAQNVKKQLEKSNCKILGVVLNKVNMEKNGYYGRYYGKYYGKYYGTYGNETDR